MDHTSMQSSFRVFISSTFSDMLRERDTLAKNVFPRLQHLCARLGVHWKEVDLRWGVTDEEQSQGLVIPLCFQGVDSCRPYFIGLFGDRYGSPMDQFPPAVLLEYPWLDDFRGRSLTEMEVQYGVLRAPVVPRALFYRRTPPDQAPEDKRQIDRMCEALNVHGFTVNCYEDPQGEAFKEMVFRDVEALILEDFGSVDDLKPGSRGARSARAAFVSHTPVYQGFASDIMKLDGFLAGNERALVLCGQESSGKTALLSAWLCRLWGKPQTRGLRKSFGSLLTADKEQAARAVLGRFTLILSPERTSLNISADDYIGDLMRNIAETVEMVIPDMSMEDQRLFFPTLLAESAQTAPILLILDGLEHLVDPLGEPDLAWLPECPPNNVKIIVSLREGSGSAMFASWKAWKTSSPTRLKKRDQADFISLYLKHFHKKLPQELLNLIASKAPDLQFLRVLLDELRVVGAHETLRQTVNNYLVAENVQGLFRQVLQRQIEDTASGSTEIIKLALTALWLSKDGLPEPFWRRCVLGQETAKSRRAWETLLVHLHPFLIERGERVDYRSVAFRRAVAEFLHEPMLSQRAGTALIDGLYHWPWDAFSVAERPYQLFSQQRWQSLYDLLCDGVFLQHAVKYNAFNLTTYWQELNRHGFSVEAGLTVWIATPERDPSVSWPLIQVLARLQRHELISGMLGKLLEKEPTNADYLVQKAASEFTLGKFSAATGTLKRILDRPVPSFVRARCLDNLGVVYVQLNDPLTATQYLEEASQLWCNLDIALGLHRNKARRAECLVLSGNLLEAKKELELVAAFFRRLGAKRDLVACLGNLGVICFQRERFTEADQFWAEEASLCRRLNMLEQLQVNMGNRARSESSNGNHDGAYELMKNRLALCRDIGNPNGEAQTLLQLSELFGITLRQAKKAGEYLQIAAALAQTHQLTSIEEELVAMVNRINRD